MSGIIVTGGSGYIGQEIIRAALARTDSSAAGGRRVVNIDIQPPRPPHPALRGHPSYFDINEHPAVTFIRADVSDPDEASRAFDAAAEWLQGPICGVANLSGLVKYGTTFERLYRPNVLTAGTVAAQCASRTLPFLHFSGTAVHGNGLRAPVKESDPFNPVEAYGRSKVASEQAIFDQVVNHGLRAAIFRSTNPVGPQIEGSDLNKLYETIVTSPIILAVKDSNNSYVSTIDVGRVFVYALENADRVLPAQPKVLSDIVYNLGAATPFSDYQVMAHLESTILGRVRKPIIQLPARAALGLGYVSTLAARVQGFVLRREVDPVLHYELARLFDGWHCQDMTRFDQVFGSNGFALMHDTPEKVLDVGTAYKFLTGWATRPIPEPSRIAIEAFLAGRARDAYL